MRICGYIIAAMLACSCTGLVESGPPKYIPDIEFSGITNYTVGAWVNIHSNHPGLIGISVDQFPECACKMASAPYEGKHPAWVFFLFTNDLVHAINYHPNGSAISAVWTNIPNTGRNWIWNNPDMISITNGILHNTH